VVLVEEGDHLVALLPLGHLGADLEDGAGTVGGAHDGEGEREGVLVLFLGVVNMSSFGRRLRDGFAVFTYPEDDEITVVEGRALELDEHLVLADLGDGGIGLELEAVEALLARDHPLLLSRRKRHGGVFVKREMQCGELLRRRLFDLGQGYL